ncbi:hypothetical protein FRB90_003206 [Tulasnella sp. 427]|nr:hypothetical protein FRB90_003206 [Tulasnella sp. 427]
MEPDSIVQPGAPTLEHVPIPNPLDGEFHYSVFPPAATGGFSDVFKATWTRGDHASTVCVKRLRMNIQPLPNLDPVERLGRRIRRETIVWSMAQHRNIYPYIGFQTLEATRETLLISPWSENGNLDVYLHKNPDLSRISKINLLKDTASGLKFLHGLSPPIVHGDISPGNVLIHIIDGALVATLTDFGLSRVMTESGAHTGLTTAGTLIGTAGFCAKELLGGINTEAEPPTPMSDVYALGGGMSGRKPFYRKATAMAIIWAIGNDETPNPQDHAPALLEDDPLWPHLFQCWSPNPVQRPTAGQIVATLDAM